METIYGVRLCRVCKGIMHDVVWRDNYGERKSYYCSYDCVKEHAEKDFKKSGYKYSAASLERNTRWFIREMLEKVRVITR